jgi:HPt (histidine-containing phosphotransfer) domain-containing protein
MDGYLSKPIRVDLLYDAVEGIDPSLHVEGEDFTDSEPVTSVDWDDALERLGGNEKTLKELAELFLRECPKMVVDIERAISSGDTTSLRRAAHTLKGSADVFAAKPTVGAAFRVESIGREGNLVGVEEAMVVLMAELELLTPALKERIESIDS